MPRLTVTKTSISIFHGTPGAIKQRSTLKQVGTALKALRQTRITWHEPPWRILTEALNTGTNNFINLGELLAHKLILQRTKHLLMRYVEFVLAPQHDMSGDPETATKEDFD